MKKKQVVSMMMAAMLAVSALSGFTSRADDGERMDILLEKHDVSKYTEDQTIKGMLEEKWNVNLIPDQIPSDQEAVNLRIASGDIPELLWDVPFANYREYVNQGMLAEIPLDTVKEYAPRYYDWIVRNLGENGFSYVDVDGKNYSLPTPWTLANNQSVIAWREDILKEAGVDKIPETIDEMEAALLAVKEKTGSAPYSIAGGSGMDGLSAIYGAYNSYLCYYDKDGKIVYGPLEEEAKEAVTLLHKWYEEGIIDPEFMINKIDNVKEKWNNGQVAVTQHVWWNFLPKEAFFEGAFYEPLKDEPNVSIVVTDPPAGPNGDKGITQGNPLSNAGLCFGKQMEGDQEKVQKYLEIINDMFDRDTMDLINYGVEGETYNYNEETGVEWIPPYDSEEERDAYGIGMYMAVECFNDYDLQAKYMTQPKYLDLRNDAESHGIGIYDVLKPLYRPIYDEKFDILDKIYTNAHIDFITGARDISEWDDFVNEWMSAGGSEVLEEAQATYEKIK